MKKGGTIFPERIDSYPQLPLVQENTTISIASNAIRSAVIKIEETIGEKVLNSRIFKKIKNIKHRLDLLEDSIGSSIIIIDDEYEELSLLKLDKGCWKKIILPDKEKNIGIYLGENKVLISGTCWLDNVANLAVGDRFTIINNNICVADELNYLGTVISKDSKLIQVILKNTW